MIAKDRIFKKGDVIVSGFGNIRILVGETGNGEAGDGAKGVFYDALPMYCDGVVFPKNPSSISFDIPVTPDLRELFGELTKKRRLPRKLKKAIKVRVAKRFRTKVKEIKLVRK